MGIVVILFLGGKIVYFMFKIFLDLDINEILVCVIFWNSEKVKIFVECSLIVWDECMMVNKKVVEVVNCIL